jgi:Family of unknown function (DUF6452)
MKKLIGCILLLGVLSLYMISCEKDDLCDPLMTKTPNMVVEFYSADNREEPQVVSNLRYNVEGRTEVIAVGNTDSTAVPLRVDTTATKWAFTRDKTVGAGVIQAQTDYVEFKYTTRDEYVSRACGFKTLFTLDGAPNAILTAGDDGDFWIQSVEIEEYEIENENEVHVKIYF